MLSLSLALLLQSAAQQPVRPDTVGDSTRTRARKLEGVQVTAVRGRAPISEKTLTRAEIQRGYTGQETPILLQAAPGITAYSESGSASNYSYIRLRGIDQTRINITLDGVPLNEPEDQALYFSNFPDFANSISSVQVQRGVGSSTHGTAAYAGSVNFESIPIAGVSRGGEVQLTAGSYNTSRASASFTTGLMPSGFAGYVRGSAQQTDGYRFNSGNKSRSLFASGGWFGGSDVVKLTLLAGLSSNDQAYYAVPLSVLRTRPRDNPFGNTPQDELTDRFHQDLLSVAWTHAFSGSTSVATTLYGFDAGGWYDFPGSNGPSDAYSYRLHSRWGGLISALDWQGSASSASVGVNVARYGREHWLVQRPVLDTRHYDNTSYKGEQSAFAKASVTRGRTTWSGDIQLRAVQFRYRPTSGTPVTPATVRWSFLNPKVGISTVLGRGLGIYASVGMNGREPTRADMFAGADDIDSVQAVSVFPLTRVHPETAYDLETGVTIRRRRLSAQANVFVMQFRNEIAPIGEINTLGYSLRKNVERSARRGVEADAVWRWTPRLTLSGDASVTHARIATYRDDPSGIVYRDVAPIMTPKLVSNHGVRSELASWLSLDVNGRYTSRMMLTNTNDPRFVVPESWYADAGATLRVSEHSLLVQVRNVFDRRVYTGGYPGASAESAEMEPYYFILAPRHVSVNLRLMF